MLSKIVQLIQTIFSTRNASLSQEKVILLVAFFVCLESFLCNIIIKKVNYTEIDWIAYMQEVTFFINGERNYKLIYGDTGPLVYPAGFVYIFCLLRYVTDNGSNIQFAQYIFMGIYVVNIVVILLLYISSENTFPLWILMALALSKRIHSIYILRMFNDCIAVLLGYIALYFFTKQQWRFGSFIYSLSVSIKMNMLLYAPGILFLYLVGLGFQETIICLSICAIVQLILGYPFLSTYPAEYLIRSFDIGRVFMFKWTVNFKFLSEAFFISKSLSIGLLLATILGMIFFWRKLINESFTLHPKPKTVQQLFTQLIGPRRLSNHFIVYTAFMSNFIGITFARSLHYQFYCWYFHTLPYLLWTGTDLPLLLKLGIILSIEVSFNIYPSTPWSSLLLQSCHMFLLFALFYKSAPKCTIEIYPQDNQHQPSLKKISTILTTDTNTDRNTNTNTSTKVIEKSSSVDHIDKIHHQLSNNSNNKMNDNDNDNDNNNQLLNNHNTTIIPTTVTVTVTSVPLTTNVVGYKVIETTYDADVKYSHTTISPPHTPLWNRVSEGYDKNIIISTKQPLIDDQSDASIADMNSMKNENNNYYDIISINNEIIPIVSTYESDTSKYIQIDFPESDATSISTDINTCGILKPVLTIPETCDIISRDKINTENTMPAVFGAKHFEKIFQEKSKNAAELCNEEMESWPKDSMKVHNMHLHHHNHTK